MRKGLAAALVTGSLLTGGAIGTAFFGPGTATAQTSSDSSSSQSSTAPSDAPGAPGPRGPHRGGHHLNLSVAASTIGVSEDDLKTALQSGQSIADVATANNVDPQTVIDALVADAQQHLADDVSSGKLTQDQADQISADLQTRITDAVNRAGLRGGPGGGGCPGMGDDQNGPPAPPADSGSSSSSATSTDS